MKGKILYITAISLCVLGVLCVIVSAVISDFSFAEMTGHTPVESQFALDAGITRLEVSEIDADIRVSRSPTDRIEIKAVYDESSCFAQDEYTADGETVYSIRKEFNRRWYDYIFNLNFTENYIEIKIPDGCFLELTVSGGDISCEKVNCTGLSATASYGNIAVANSEIDESLEVKTVCGAVYLERTRIGGEAAVQSANGGVSLISVEAENISAEADCAGINLDRAQAEAEIYAEAEYGDIYIDGCDFGTKLTLSCEYGNISGTLAGKADDYTVIADADYGSNSLSRTDGEGQRRAKIYAYYGDINLSFEEDRKNSPLTDGNDSPPYAYTGEPDGEPSPHGETEKTEPEDGTPGDEIIPEGDGVPQGEERMQSSGGFALPLVPAVMSPSVRTFCMLAD